jgi:hypothetical protein
MATKRRPAAVYRRAISSSIVDTGGSGGGRVVGIRPPLVERRSIVGEV